MENNSLTSTARKEIAHLPKDSETSSIAAQSKKQPIKRTPAPLPRIIPYYKEDPKAAQTPESSQSQSNTDLPNPTAHKEPINQVNNDNGIDSDTAISPKPNSNSPRKASESSSTKAPKPFPDASTLRSLLSEVQSVKDLLTATIEQLLETHHDYIFSESTRSTISRELTSLNCYGPECEIQFIPGNLIQLDLRNKTRNQALKKALLAENVLLTKEQDTPTFSILAYLENVGRLRTLFQHLHRDSPNLAQTLLKTEIITYAIFALIELHIETETAIPLSEIQTRPPIFHDRNEYTALFKRLLLEQNQPAPQPNPRLQLTASNLTNQEAIDLAISLLPESITKRRTKTQNQQRRQQLRNLFETVKPLRKIGEGNSTDQILCDYLPQEPDSFFLYTSGILHKVLLPTTALPENAKPTPESESQSPSPLSQTNETSLSNPSSNAALPAPASTPAGFIESSSVLPPPKTLDPNSSSFSNNFTSTFNIPEESLFYRVLTRQYHWLIVLLILIGTVGIITYFLNTPPEQNPLNKLLPPKNQQQTEITPQNQTNQKEQGTTVTPKNTPHTPQPLPQQPQPARSLPAQVQSTGQAPTSIEWK